MRVEKWGESLVLRLSPQDVEAHGLKEGDEVMVHIEKERNPPPENSIERAAIIESLWELHGAIPSDFKFDREEANER